MLMPEVLLPPDMGRMGTPLAIGFRELHWSRSEDISCLGSSYCFFITLLDELSLAARAFILKGGSYFSVKQSKSYSCLGSLFLLAVYLSGVEYGSAEGEEGLP